MPSFVGVVDCSIMEKSEVFSSGETDVISLCGSIHSDSDRLYSGHDSLVKVWNLLTRQMISSIETKHVVQGEVSSICEISSTLLAIAVNRSVLVYHFRDFSTPCQSYVNCTKEEINQIVVNKKGEFLTACDDSGEILIIDVESSRKCKTCRRHDNICSAVVFNPRRPWEIISGGLDCQLISWDFSRAKLLSSMNMSDVQSSSQSDNSSYSINPPMIHTLCTIPDQPLVVAGLGNGSIVLVNVSKRSNMELISVVSSVHSSAVNVISCSLITEPSVQHSLESSERGAVVNDIQPILLSGGNDGKIVISKFTTTSVQRAGYNPRLHITDIKPSTTVDHLSKVNCICRFDNPKCVFVSDVTSNITIYKNQ